jgi:guanylate kinase
VSVFLRTSGLETYEARLRKRGTEDEAAIERRVANARGELAHAGEYAHQVVNDDLDQAVAQLRKIVRSQFQKGDVNAG